MVVFIWYIYLFSHFIICDGYTNITDTTSSYSRNGTTGKKRTMSGPRVCETPKIENLERVRALSFPPTIGTWTQILQCKIGYTLIGPCRLVCQENNDGSHSFAPPYELNFPTCVKENAASQFSCNYLSSTCPLVWDHDEDPAKISVAISRIFCGQILDSTPHVRAVFGFGASIFANQLLGDYCLYKGGIKNDPCFIVKGQRMVPVAKGVYLPAITYSDNMDGFKALLGYMDPYVAKLSENFPNYLFPTDVTPLSLVTKLRDYHTSCVEYHGRKFMRCTTVTFLTSKIDGFDIIAIFGGDMVVNGILDAFPLLPSQACGDNPCCCDLNNSQR